MASNRPAPAIAPNSWAGMVRLRSRQLSLGQIAYRTGSAAGSILAVQCKPSSPCVPERKKSSFYCWGRESRKMRQ
jgi:hypothetical protein